MPIPAALVGIVNGAKALWNHLPEEMRATLLSSTKDVARSVVSGKKSVEEFAEVFSEAIDRYIEQGINEDGLTYVGGKLIFSIEEESEKVQLEWRKVLVTYELYFQNSEKKWLKQVPPDSIKLAWVYFTPEAIEDIKQGKSVFEINYP